MFIKQKSSNHESKKCVYIQLSLPIRCFSYMSVSSMTSCIICTNCIMYFSNLHTRAIVLRSEKWLFNSFNALLVQTALFEVEQHLEFANFR